MKRNAGRAAPLGGVFWEGGAETFIHKGSNGRWRMSHRRFRTRCGGTVMTGHPGMGFTGVAAGVLPSVAVVPSVHLN